MPHIALRQYQNHPRDWRHNLYVYPVISRRSRGLSIGINLNPDTACNFACVYCQVDRSRAPRVRNVDLARLRLELEQMLAGAQNGSLFDDEAFADLPDNMRQVKDLAFSGDGEPTTCRHFRRCVDLVATLKREAGLVHAKIVLITDGCYLTRPQVVAGMAVMDENNGEVWVKLDAGTEAYYRKVNRPNYPLRHVLDNIIAASRIRPVVIQSLFMRLHGLPPDEEELFAYADRLNEITCAGGTIDHVQVYTVARPPAEAFVTPLADVEIERIARLVRERADLRAEAFYTAPRDP